MLIKITIALFASLVVYIVSSYFEQLSFLGGLHKLSLQFRYPVCGLSLQLLKPGVQLQHKTKITLLLSPDLNHNLCNTRVSITELRIM